MKNLSPSRMILSMLLCGCSGLVIASEADKLQEQVRAMRNKAAAISANAKKEAGLGNKEQAERLRKESIKMQEAAEQLALKARGPGDEGERPEVREKTAGDSRELRLTHAKLEGLPPELRAHAENLEAASRRIHHLKVAAENLKMAEAHEQAHDLMKRAESMEREVQEGRKRLHTEIQSIHRRVHGPEHAPDIVLELRKEIEDLRAEVKELRHKLEKR